MLKGKLALITGGTRGIGFAIVEKYLENGARVVLFGSRQETVDEAIGKLREKNSDYKLEGFPLDLKNPDEIDKKFREIYDKYGSLDILVNNAGISHTSLLYDYKPEDFKNIMELNVNAVFFASQSAAKIMKEQGGGVILNTSSMVSKYGQSRGVGYPASKFAVNGLTISLARELGRDNIRVNAVAPGVINTDMVKALPEHLIKPIVDGIPLKRIGEPEDIANAFVFLASDMASYITGEVLSVDGASLS